MYNGWMNWETWNFYTCLTSEENAYKRAVELVEAYKKDIIDERRLRVELKKLYRRLPFLERGQRSYKYFRNVNFKEIIEALGGESEVEFDKDGRIKSVSRTHSPRSMGSFEKWCDRVERQIDRKMTWKDWLGMFGISTVTATTLTLIWVFYTAYFIKGVTRVLIDFNAYGEAIPEMIIFPLGLFAFWFWLLKRDR